MSAFGDGNEYILVNAAGRSVVDLSGGSPNNHTAVTGWRQHVNPAGEGNQIWKVKFTEKDQNNYQWCTLTNRASGTSLDLPSGKPDDGTQIEGYTKNDSPNQQWLFWPVDNTIPVYVIYNRAARTKTNNWHCLDLNGGNGSDGNRIQIFTASSLGTNNNQVWMLIKVN